MAITLKRILKEDRQEVLTLVKSRIDSKSNVCLTTNLVNLKWYSDVLTRPETYDRTHRIFGLYEDTKLHTIIVLNLQSNVYVVSMVIKDQAASTIMVNGYEKHTTELIDFAIREMEKEGLTTFYSAIPNHPKWKKSDKNPNRIIKNEYTIEEVELIPAGELPVIPFHFTMITRPFSLDMVIRKFTKNV